MYIEKVNSPADVKKLSVGELNELSGEIRRVLLNKLSTHGGHVGPNLGMVEATIALHYVFDSPTDKIVYDVSHQSYTHKILTGRRAAFMNADEYDEVSGYSEPSESEHDFFVIGHTSTSVSLASGLAKARDLKGETGNVIAVIGDGSLSGGEAFEGLNVGAELGTNFIVIVNDNQMSIAENHGGLYRNLQQLRETDGQAPCNYFKAMGYDYLYVKDGNDVEQLIEAFRTVKDVNHPVVVHINTLKGKGYKLAEEQKERFHYSAPFDLNTGNLTGEPGEGEDYADLTADYLLQKMKKDPTVVGITAGTPTVFGFTPERRKEAGRQFIDMGIAEEQAVAMASAIAAGGGKPVFGVYSTFIQRAYDQLSQDLCINNNPALILVFWGSLSSMNDVTHFCLFDIPVIGNIPNMVYLAPTCREEYMAMLEWGIRQTEHPVAIRVPANGVIRRDIEPEKDYGKILNRYEVSHGGEKVAILGLGSFYQLGEAVAARLKEEKGMDATLVNPRYITGVDEALLDDLKQDHTLVITLEDGVLDGGFGEKIARYYGPSDMKVLNYGVKKEFIDRYDVEEQMKKNRLTVPQIVEDICRLV
ncbi:1-deoxy-D-xylulose-5-phosphate synthase [Bacteroides muris (ex Fokt et al. 2023)]|uniref:1-deoxy-D-xylulose-5-phosphate synthase n=1 Tax=Bacteroides muris (ex Fokt et al. 2023) TaxID=2937417 RepID=A0A9X2NU07_9BACE|nr:1-deoxy-D-xylulose-5-phosphate synthase [Bacteroides muris (ex Fokt et al. 2023)]MCR6505879.1 1-deoxy-D-xylulose-5-phosphate synthase [Bacteroides muris (ex Fokt et al. 2023)]